MSNSVADQGPPPLPHRRPRVREVSSRFMSPVSSAGDLHSLTTKSPKHSISTPAPDRSSKPSQRRLVLRTQPPEPFSSSSENIPVPETARSMETPFQYAKPESLRKQRGSVKENGYVDQIQALKLSSVRTSKSSRPDTPSGDRIVPSRYRQPVTDAAKLLQSTGLSVSGSFLQNLGETEVKGGSCPNSPISSQNTPDENLTSNRLLLRSSNSSSISCQTSFSTPSLCTRSLNLHHTTHCKIGSAATSLPPQPTGAKLGVDSKKGKKPQPSQQDIHSLKLLHNRYVQWRFANAKAQASLNAQTTEMEKQFFSIGADISHLRDTVKRKQVELAILRRTKALSTVLEAQMPYLDKWSALEEDYTKSLSGVITALTNSLLRLPISGNVQVNIKDAAEALDSAVKTTDMIVHQMQIFLPKAEEMDSLMSELANVIDVEKALVEECGNILTKTNTLQVEDCSLRGHLMQVTCSRTINEDTFVGQKSRCS